MSESPSQDRSELETAAEDVRFDISSAVVRQLGEQLISDEVTALLELVKNAYDADANYARIVVDTTGIYTDEKTHFPFKASRPTDADPQGPEPDVGEDESENPETTLHREPVPPGYILIEDDGTGMSPDDIERGWLTISLSDKREMKRAGRTSPKKERTPLGDKGLGRLSAQRLGSKLEMFTVKERPVPRSDGEVVWTHDDDRQHVAVDWDLFEEGVPLSRVPVRLETEPRRPRERGTRLLITALQNADVWRRSEGEQSALVGGLTQLVSPFVAEPQFRVLLSIDGEEFDFEHIGDRVRSAAISTHEFYFDGESLTIEGKVGLRALVGNDKKDVYRQMIGNDQGRKFAEFLSRKKVKIPNVTFFPSKGWFFSYGVVRDLPPGLEYEGEGDDRQIADPGTFQGEIDQYRYTRADLSDLGDIFNDAAAYKDFLNRQRGVHIYRDGFGIRPYGIDGEDWLDLGKGQTSGRSAYGLRPSNVVGYVSISARDNPNLEEKTDREGFVNTPVSRNFFRLTDAVVTTINSVLERLRREYVAFKNERQKELAGVLNTENVVSEMRSTSTQAKKAGAAGSDALAVAEAAVEVAAGRVEGVSADPDLLAALRAARDELGRARKAVEEIYALREMAARLDGHAEFVEQRFEYLQEQIGEFAELAGLGLTAEALTHELAQIADRVLRETRELTQTLRQKEIVVAEVSAYTEFMRSAMSAMRKQLSHIAPSLRYVRETQDEVHIEAFLRQIARYYKGKKGFKEAGIDVVLEAPFEDFVVTVNKGKLTQVIDNLVLNSEYWLREGRRRGTVEAPRITFRSSPPYVDVFDNGPGIAKEAMVSMFEPFNTTKPKEEGRGLGLFIVRQLLDASGSDIYVLPDLNEHGKQYIFRLDLSGMVTS